MGFIRRSPVNNYILYPEPALLANHRADCLSDSFFGIEARSDDREGITIHVKTLSVYRIYLFSELIDLNVIRTIIQNIFKSNKQP